MKASNIFEELKKLVGRYSTKERARLGMAFGRTLARELEEAFTQGKIEEELAKLPYDFHDFLVVDGENVFSNNNLEIFLEEKKIPYSYLIATLSVLGFVSEYLFRDWDILYRPIKEKISEESKRVFHLFEAKIKVSSTFDEAFTKAFGEEFERLAKKREVEVLKEKKELVRFVIRTADEAVERMRKRLINTLLSNERLLQALDVFLEKGKIKRVFATQEGTNFIKEYLKLELFLEEAPYLRLFSILNRLEPERTLISEDGSLGVFACEYTDTLTVSEQAQRVRLDVGFLMFTRRINSSENSIVVAFTEFPLFVEFENQKEINRAKEKLLKIADAMIETARARDRKLIVYVPQEHFREYSALISPDPLLYDSAGSERPLLSRFNKINAYRRFYKIEVSEEKVVADRVAFKPHFSSSTELAEFLANRKEFRKVIYKLAVRS